MDERRRHQRVERYFECAWRSEWGEEHSRASNLSEGGCYVESRRAVSQGTHLSAITIMLPTGEITVQGVVVHAIRGVGFAVQFTEVDPEARAGLSALAQL